MSNTNIVAPVIPSPAERKTAFHELRAKHSADHAAWRKALKKRLTGPVPSVVSAAQWTPTTVWTAWSAAELFFTDPDSLDVEGDAILRKGRKLATTRWGADGEPQIAKFAVGVGEHLQGPLADMLDRDDALDTLDAVECLTRILDREPGSIRDVVSTTDPRDPTQFATLREALGGNTTALEARLDGGAALGARGERLRLDAGRDTITLIDDGLRQVIWRKQGRKQGLFEVVNGVEREISQWVPYRTLITRRGELDSEGRIEFVVGRERCRVTVAVGERAVPLEALLTVAQAHKPGILATQANFADKSGKITSLSSARRDTDTFIHIMDALSAGAVRQTETARAGWMETPEGLVWVSAHGIVDAAGEHAPQAIASLTNHPIVTRAAQQITPSPAVPAGQSPQLGEHFAKRLAEYVNTSFSGRPEFGWIMAAATIAAPLAGLLKKPSVFAYGDAGTGKSTAVKHTIGYLSGALGKSTAVAMLTITEAGYRAGTSMIGSFAVPGDDFKPNENAKNAASNSQVALMEKVIGQAVGLAYDGDDSMRSEQNGDLRALKPIDVWPFFAAEALIQDQGRVSRMIILPFTGKEIDGAVMEDRTRWADITGLFWGWLAQVGKNYGSVEEMNEAHEALRSEYTFGQERDADSARRLGNTAAIWAGLRTCGMPNLRAESPGPALGMTIDEWRATWEAVEHTILSESVVEQERASHANRILDAARSMIGTGGGYYVDAANLMAAASLGPNNDPSRGALPVLSRFGYRLENMGSEERVAPQGRTAIGMVSACGRFVLITNGGLEAIKAKAGLDGVKSTNLHPALRKIVAPGTAAGEGSLKWMNPLLKKERVFVLPVELLDIEPPLDLHNPDHWSTTEAGPRFLAHHAELATKAAAA